MGEVLSEERASYNSLELKTWVGIFQVGVFGVGIIQEEIFQEGVWWVGIFQGEIFLEP